MTKILFLDDDPFANLDVQFIRDTYGRNGDKEIVLIQSVSQLISLINDEGVRYDLFVIDLIVPCEDEDLFNEEDVSSTRGITKYYTGLHLAKRIRNIEKYRTVPIIFFSFTSSFEIPEELKENTFFLQKHDYSPEEFAYYILRVLKLN